MYCLCFLFVCFKSISFIQSASRIFHWILYKSNPWQPSPLSFSSDSSSREGDISACFYFLILRIYHVQRPTSSGLLLFRVNTMQFCTFVVSCTRFIMSEDTHEKCDKCLGVQHAQASLTSVGYHTVWGFQDERALFLASVLPGHSSTAAVETPHGLGLWGSDVGTWSYDKQAYRFILLSSNLSWLSLTSPL